MQKAKKQKTQTQNRNIFNVLSEDVFIGVCLPFLDMNEHCRVARLCKSVNVMMDTNPARVFWKHSKKKQVLISRKTPLTTWKKLANMCTASHMLIMDCNHLRDIELEWGFPLSRLTVFRSSVDISFVNGMSSSLEYVHLKGTATTDVSRLQDLNLKSLAIVQERRLKQDWFTGIVNMVSLRHLDLNYSVHVRESMQHVSNLKKLEILNLNSTDISNDSMFFLRDMTSLVTLSLLGNCIDDECLIWLQNLTNLREVDISNCLFSGDERFQYLRHVKKLNVSNNEFLNTLNNIVTLPLQKLNLVGLPCRNFMNLDLNKTIMSLNISRYTGNISFMEDTSLENFIACEANIDDWSKIPSASKMTLRGSNICNDDFKTLKNVTKLDISDCKNITCLKNLDEISSLRELYLSKISYLLELCLKCLPRRHVENFRVRNKHVNVIC